jgi:hypothetical protein
MIRVLKYVYKNIYDIHVQGDTIASTDDHKRGSGLFGPGCQFHWGRFSSLSESKPDHSSHDTKLTADHSNHFAFPHESFLITDSHRYF